MLKRGYVLLVLLCLRAGGLLHAQQPFFKNYNVEHGLPSPEVYSILCDSKGYIWAGTDAGVSRFDGYKFDTFDTQAGLPDNTVYEIQEDSRGRIWFRNGSAFSYIFNNRVYPLAINSFLKKVLKLGIISSFYVDSASTLWFPVNAGVYCRIVYPYGPRDRQFIPAPQLKSNYMCIIDWKGQIWGPSRRDKDIGLVCMDTKGWLKSINAKMDNRMVHKAGFMLKNGHALLGTGKNLVEVSKQAMVEHKLDPMGDYLCIFQDADSNVWLGTRNGVICVEKSDLEYGRRHTYIPDVLVTGITQDFEGGLWFSSINEGIFYLRNRNVLNFGRPEGLPGTNVNTIESSGNNTFLLGLYDGVEVLKGGKVTHFEHKGFRGSAAALLRHSSGSIWAGGEMSLDSDQVVAVMDPTLTKPFFIRKCYTKCFAESRDKSVWMGNASIIFRYSADGRKLLQHFPCGFRISAMCESRSGRLWLAGLDGLRYYDHDSIRVFNQKNPLFNGKISDVKCDGPRTIIATKGRGIVTIDSSGGFRNLSRKDGMASNFCKKLFIDSCHNIWVGTNNGISRVSPSGIIKNFNTLDGLISGEIKDLLVLRDTVWMVTNKGVSYFNPQNIPMNTPPFLHVTGLTASGSIKAPLDRTIQLSYAENYVVINYKGISYKNSGHLIYKYRMEGLSPTWFYTYNTSVQYASMAPGDYTFMIFAINSDGLESRIPGRLHLIISPPFWQRWWFIASAVLLVLLSVVLLISAKIKRIRRDNEIEKKLLINQLKALQSQMNPHFIFNCLNSIQLFIIENDVFKSQRFLSKFAKLVRYVLDHSNISTIPLEEELKALSLYLELESMRLRGKFDYRIEIPEDVMPESVKIPTMLIQPYVENAIWHGFEDVDKKGLIVISFSISGDILNCVIQDNGIGRKKALANRNEFKTHKSFGMNVTRERLEIINILNQHKLSVNIIDLEDEEGNALGTRVELFIPLH